MQIPFASEKQNVQKLIWHAAKVLGSGCLRLYPNSTPVDREKGPQKNVPSKVGLSVPDGNEVSPACESRWEVFSSR